MSKTEHKELGRRNFLKGGTAAVISLGAVSCLPFGRVFFTGTANAASQSTLGVVKGPTPIDQGMAIHENDFTIYNDKIAVAFAVGSNNYWNMTSGSILDVAIMKDGKFGVDLVNDIEFLNDLWTATGSYNNEDLLHVPAADVICHQDTDKIVVTAKTRYWTAGHKLPLNVGIEYTLEAGKNYVGLKTTVENPAGNEPYENMYSGYSISTLASSMYGPFGYHPDVKTTGIGIGADKDVNEKYAEFVISYGKDYAVSTLLEGANAYKGSSGYKDVYTLRTIEPGKSYVYVGEILVIDKGETAPVLERYLEKDPAIPAAVVQGEVKDSSGKNVAGAYIIVSKKGSYKETVKSHGADALKKDILQPLVWKIAAEDGKFSMRLPQDEYEMHVEAMGFTPSDSQQVKLDGDKALVFTVKDGARALFRVKNDKGEPIHAKVTVSGTTSTIKTLGGTVFFSDAKTREIGFNLAAPENEVTFTVTHAGDFETLPASVTKRITPREDFSQDVVIPALIKTNERGWYSADIHQHSDIGDGASPIGELHKAQLAAGLNCHSVSDHDSVANNANMDKLAKESGKPFLSSLEVSPGWGHWGILGVDFNKEPISPNLPPAEIIKAGHAMGALVVVNHPYTDYGFFANRDGVKGGFDEGSEDFDFLEIQSTIALTDAKNIDKRALDLAMTYWDKGSKKYLSSGSDQHDVTSGLYPGIIRMYAYIDGELSAKKFMESMKAGSSYLTMGPIITPSTDSMFGSTKKVAPGKALTLSIELQAVNGLKNVQVISEQGKVVAEKEFGDTKDAVQYDVNLTPEKDTWYNFVVLDSKGRYAVTNPIWVTVGK
ncbi:CehA/McbA family metallohydrolase [Desulfovibrio sp. OttesenSCG-928-G15]|nr:CehA/McbA family metallohydrolase [Desulfovibrio sp. OttesenSCG-928-G15]